MAAAQSVIDVLIDGEDKLSPQLSAIESRLIRFVGAVSSALATIKTISFPIQAAASLQEELINVQKTTNFTTQQIQSLQQQLLALSLTTNVSAVDLAKIAAAAGQQGLGKTGVEGVIQFTDSVSRMSSVLDVTAEEAATNIGKILNIFKLPISEVERAVSTFNQVSNNSVASGKELLDVVKRIGDAGGSLNLAQTTGLAATGLGLGLSEEVVGSAVSNFFLKFREKAPEIVKILDPQLKITADRWMALVGTDGVAALELYLDGLRRLTPQAQATAITKITGGGRQGTLTQKLVQDSTNDVLDRDQAQALQGFLQGTSALKEEQNVLAGFNSQLKIAYNSLFKLGSQAALTPIAGPDGKTAISVLQQLAAYAGQFALALQAPAIQSFVSQLLAAFSDLAKGIADVIGFVAGLNVNWENFVKVAKVIVAVKLAQTLTEIFGKVTGLNTATASLAKTMQTYGQVAPKSMLASAAAAAKEATGFQQLEAIIAAYNARKQQQLAIEQQVTAAQARAAQAATDEAAAVAAATSSLSAVRNAAAAVTAARANVTAAQTDGASNVAAVEAARNASIQKAQATHNANMLQIEQTYQTERAAIRATGTRVGLTALQREYASQNQQNDAQLAKSLQGIETYWNSRLAYVQQAAQRETNIQLAALQAQQVQLDSALAQHAGVNANLATAQGNANSANSAANAATAAAVAAASPTLTVFQRIQQTGTVAFQVLASGVQILVRSLSALAAVASKAFLWVTIIYSAADALGIVDRLSGSFGKLTDWLGLTSQAQRDAALAAQAHSARLKDQAKELDELTASYNKYIDARTGSVSQNTAQNLAEATTQGDSNQRQQALTTFAQTLAGAYGKLNSAGSEVQQNQENVLNQKIAQLQDIQKRIDGLRQLISASQQGAGPVGIDGLPALDTSALQQQLKDAQTQFDVTSKAVETLKSGIQSAPTIVNTATDSIKNLATATASIFTPQSAAAFTQFITPLGEARDRAAEYLATLKTAQEQFQTVQDAPDSQKFADAKKAVDDATASYQAQNQTIFNLQQGLRDYITAQAKVPGLDPKVLQSFVDLLAFLDATSVSIKGVSQSIATVGKLGLPFTGTNTGSNPQKPTTGTGTYTPGNKSADSLAKAQFELQKAQLKAQFDLQKEQFAQIQDLSDDFYNRGLKNYQDYFEQRRDIQLKENQQEIVMLQQQLAALAKERADASTPAAKTRVDANVAQVQGQIAVLRAQQKGITQQNELAMRTAQEAFNDLISSETQTAISDLIKPSDISGIFDNALTVGLAQARKTLNELRDPKAGPLANSVANDIEIGIKFKALNTVQDIIGKQTQQAYNEIDRLQASLTARVTQGAVTSQQSERALNQEIQAQIPFLTQQIALMEQSLNDNGSNLSAEAYKQLSANIDDARVKLLQLEAQQNATAKSINASVTDSLTTALDNLEPTLSSARTVVLQFLLDVTNALKKTFAQDLAQSIQQWATGGNAAGGLGGFVQNMLQGGKAGVGSTASALAQRGNTPITPLYVSDVNAASALGGIGDLLGGGSSDSSLLSPLGDLTGIVSSDGTAGTGGFFAGILAKFNSLTDGLISTLSSAFGTLGSSLLGLFGNLGGLLGGAGASGGLGSLGGLFAFAHTGGVIGSTPLSTRMVAPGVFRNSIRYHNGGIAGLQPDEMPAILQKGEEVITANDPRHRNNGGLAGGANGQNGLAIRNVLVTDPDFVASALQNPRGEKVIMSTVVKNKAMLPTKA